MPPWFIDIESATEAEAKSNGTPPASRTAAQASRANSPSSALHGVTRPSVEATPTKGFSRSGSLSPSARRNARCGARSSPSTVMREGRFSATLYREGSFFVLMHDLFNAGAGRKAKAKGFFRNSPLGGAVHDLLHRRIGLEAHLAARPGLHCIPHLLRAYADAIQEQRSALAEPLGRDLLRVDERLERLSSRKYTPGECRAAQDKRSRGPQAARG